MNPLVSILIPAYNASAFIDDTIRSALAQSWPRKEVIIVDDGSTDATPEIARRHASATVRVIRQDNQGAAAARNAALRLAQGDYLQWLDADDLLSVDKVAHQVRALADQGSDVLASCGWAWFRHRPLAARFERSPLWQDLTPLEWLLRKWENNCHMQTATWLVSRSITERAGPWNAALRSDDDGEYFSRVVAGSSAIRFVPDARVYYRVAPTSRLSYIGESSEKLEALYAGMQIQVALLRTLSDDARARAACTTYVRDWLPHFYPRRPDMIGQARVWARSWDGDLGSVDRLSWKYEWIRRLFGIGTARIVQMRYNETKSSLIRAWDRAMQMVEGNHIDVARL